MVPRRADGGTNFAVARRWVWECTTGGTAAGTDPSWPASVTQDVTTVSSGGATFTARRPGFSSGSTISWNFATIFLDYAVVALAAGDTLFMSSAHDETITGTVTTEFPGTLASPNFFLSVAEDGANRPTVLQEGGRITASGDVNLGSTTGETGIVVGYGVHARAGNGSSSAQFVRFGNSATNTQHWSKWINSIAELLTTDNSSTSRIDIGPDGSGAGMIEIENLRVRLNATAQRVIANRANVRIRGLSRYGTDGVSPNGDGNGVFRMTGAMRVEMEAFDASGWATNVCLFDSANTGEVHCRGIKVPVSWTGLFTNNQFGASNVNIGYRVVAMEYLTPYGLNISHHRLGNVRESATVYRTGGAAIAGTSISWRFTTTANVAWPLAHLYTHELFPLPVVASGIGVLHTLSVELLCDMASAPTNAEAWLTAIFISDVDDMLSSHASSERPAISTTATNLATSSAAWTAPVRANSTAYALRDAILVQGRVFFCTTAGTSSGSEPAGYAAAVDGDSVTDGSAVFRAGRRHRASLTFTPQQVGFVRARIHVARANITNGIYACPKLSLST